AADSITQGRGERKPVRSTAEGPPMLDVIFRHYCRNPRCRTRLIAPVENARQAFCTPGCRTSFYLRRCVVCERELPPGPANRRICRRASCRAEYRKYRHIFGVAEPGTGKDTKTVQRPPKTSIKLRAETRVRLWGPPLSPRSLDLACLPLDPATSAR